MKNINMKVAMGIFASSQLMLVMGCNSTNFASSKTSTGTTAASTSALASSVNLSIEKGGAVVASSALQVGQTYDFHVDAANVPSGASLQLLITNVDVVGAAPSTMTLLVGDNNYTPSVAGDFSYKLQLVSGGSAVATKNYQASVACAHPTFTASSLNAAGISVTAGNPNIFSMNAANVVSGANGQAPYLCAWDLTGTGIVDTGFSPCTTTLANQYINYVGSRNVGVVVKDSCNTSYAVSASPAIALADPTQSSPGNVFIQGQMSGATGTAATDKRINNVSYLATNQMPNFNIVQPSPSSNVGVGNTFEITSMMNYGQASSVNFGVDIQVAGFAGNFNLQSNPNGNLDASGAYVSKVTYNTDQAGDQQAWTSLTSTTCTSTVHVIATPTVGQPCTGGTTGDQNSLEVEVYGSYTCPMSGPEGTSTFTGTFDGYQKIADSCSGGGQGGGGVVTITE